MKYNTDKHKLIMIPSELKSELDKVILEIAKEKINNGDTKLKVSYADAIKLLLKKHIY